VSEITYNVLFLNKYFSLELYILQRIQKKSVTVSSTILGSIEDYKSAYYNDFWRIAWHWRLE